MNFAVIGLSHKTAPLELRERLAVREGQVPTLLEKLLQNADIQEAMFLSTCNRVEAYLVTKHLQRGVDQALSILSELGQVIPQELEKHLYVRHTSQAMGHFFRVTASLDSMMVGETQITAQVKEAYAQAVATNATGPSLNKIVHKALEISKKIRTETGLGQHPVSISYASVLLAEKIFGSLKNSRVLLIGAGEMGTLAAKHLVEREVGSIDIANRSEEKAIELAQEFSSRSVSISEALGQLDQYDIVISSTAADGYLVKAAPVQKAMKLRKNKPMFFIDISVPRNIDPTIHEMENVYLYDIDHLQGIVDQNLKERQKEARKAEEIIMEELRNFENYLEQRRLSPTIQQLSQKFDLIRTNEVSKYLQRLPQFTDEQKEIFEACTKAIVNKILHEPILTMKTEEVKEGSPKYSEILRKLFGLQSEG
jgi:glutamyl-tRNA reductase